jgi:bifunctional non-homologous end joining protein LigD
MLASPGLPEGDGWAMEPKFDGWRVLASMTTGADAHLCVRTRNGRDMTDRLPELSSLADVLERRDVVLDGELVAGQGLARDFYRVTPELSARRRRAGFRPPTPLTFVAFDVLWLDEPVIDRPYRERRTLLESLNLTGPAWCTVPSWGASANVYAVCAEHGLEGVVAKRLESPYRPGERSRDWVKLKTTEWRDQHAALRAPAAVTAP